MGSEDKSEKVIAFIEDLKKLLIKYDAAITIGGYGYEADGGYMEIDIPGEKKINIDNEQTINLAPEFTFKADNIDKYIY